MTITVTYICDRCKKETDKKDIYQVGLVIGSNLYSNSKPSARNTADWCGDCASAMQLFTNEFNPPPERVLSTSEKLEEIIRTIVREEIADAG